jgi:hypothetical protein
MYFSATSNGVSADDSDLFPDLDLVVDNAETHTVTEICHSKFFINSPLSTTQNLQNYQSF